VGRNQRDEAPSATISDAETSHALADVFDDEESEAALNALGTKINTIIDALEAADLIERA